MPTTMQDARQPKTATSVNPIFGGVIPPWSSSTLSTGMYDTTTAARTTHANTIAMITPETSVLPRDVDHRLRLNGYRPMSATGAASTNRTIHPFAIPTTAPPVAARWRGERTRAIGTT